MQMDLLSFMYSITLIVGGVFGYIRAGSVVSLAMGITVGLIMLYGTYQVSVDENNIWLSLLVSSLMAALMMYRFMHTGKFMPAGLVSVFSVIMIIKFALQVYNRLDEVAGKRD